MYRFGDNCSASIVAPAITSHLECSKLSSDIGVNSISSMRNSAVPTVMLDLFGDLSIRAVGDKAQRAALKEVAAKQSTSQTTTLGDLLKEKLAAKEEE